MNSDDRFRKIGGNILFIGLIAFAILVTVNTPLTGLASVGVGIVAYVLAQYVGLKFIKPSYFEGVEILPSSISLIVGLIVSHIVQSLLR